MRLAEIASILAPFEHMTAEALHGILRAPTFAALMTAQPGRGRTSPADFGPEEVARARLLLAARDCGLTGNDLIRLGAALNQPPMHGTAHSDMAKIDGGVFHPSALLSIIRGTKAGEKWEVSVKLSRTAEGVRTVEPMIYWVDAVPAESRGSRAIALQKQLEGETHLGTITLPASDLIRPLVGVSE